MLIALLVMVVAAGIAWPFVHKRLLEREAEPALEGAGGSAARVGHQEELCASCSQMNPPGRKLCIECGAQMPVNDVALLFEGSNKEDLIREGVQSGIILVGMIIAMVLASFLPTVGKLVILLATIGILGYRLLKVIQD
jgi:hypothetical protein